MKSANDNTAVEPEFAALARLGARDLHILAWMVDRRGDGVLFEIAEPRLAVRVVADGSYEFEAPAEAWCAAVDLRVALRATPEAAAGATGLPAHVIDAFARGLALGGR